MLQQNLLYTGVTRGKMLVVLVGQKKAVAIAVRNVSGGEAVVEAQRVVAAKTACLTTIRHGKLSHGRRDLLLRDPRSRRCGQSLLASAIASTLWCNIGGFDPG
jgi:hypothetical protein